MAVAARNVHCRLQHEGREGNTRDPADEADDRENAEEQEHDSTSILLARDVVDTSRERKDNVEDARDPDEGLGEVTRAQKVQPREDESNAEDEDEENESVGIQGEIVGGIVDPATTETFVRGILVHRHSRDGDIAQEDCDELREDLVLATIWSLGARGGSYQKTGPEIIKLGFLNLERVVKVVARLLRRRRGRRILRVLRRGFGLCDGRIIAIIAWIIAVVVPVRRLRWLTLGEALVGVVIAGSLSTHVVLRC